MRFFFGAIFSLGLSACGGSPVAKNPNNLPLAKVNQESATKILSRVQTITQEIATKAQSKVRASATDLTAEVDCKDGGNASAAWTTDANAEGMVKTDFTIGFAGCKHESDMIDGRLEYHVDIKVAEGSLALETQMKGDLSVEIQADGKTELVELNQDVSFALDTAKKTCAISGEVTANGETFNLDQSNCGV